MGQGSLSEGGEEVSSASAFLATAGTTSLADGTPTALQTIAQGCRSLAGARRRLPWGTGQTLPSLTGHEGGACSLVRARRSALPARSQPSANEALGDRCCQSSLASIAGLCSSSDAAFDRSKPRVASGSLALTCGKPGLLCATPLAFRWRGLGVIHYFTEQALTHPLEAIRERFNAA
jgi:hypothetical protein